MAPFPPLAGVIDGFRAPARDELGETAFAAEHAAGAEMTPENALALVLGKDSEI